MRHFLNDIEISPRNREEIGVVSDFTDNPNELALNVDSVILPREAFTIVQNHIQTIGLFEGIPYRVEMDNGVTLEYFVDLTDNAIFRSYESEVKIKRRGAIDAFREQADGTSFELMLAKGVSFDIFNVPYVIIKDNQIELALTLAISLYIMTRELIQAVRDLANLIGLLFTTIGVSGSSPGLIINLSIQVLAQIAYVGALLIAVLQLASQMFVLIFPPIRQIKACKIKELISKGCQYLGYSFDSSLLDSIPGTTIVPVPLVKERKSIFKFLPDEFFDAFNKGVPSSSDSTPTLGSLITAVENMFNARTIVYNNAVRIERRDWLQNQTTNQLIPAMVIQTDRVDEYTFNTDEAWKRYYIHYSLDYSDLHTLDEIYDFHDAEFSTEPLNVVNSDLVQIKGLNDVAIPFALGARKTGLNWLEILGKAFFSTIDAVTGIFGGGTNYASQVDARIGVLMISQNFFSTTKLLYTINGKQPGAFQNYIGAKALWNNYHSINQIQLNGWEIRNETRVRIKPADFVNLLNNNFAEIDGELCEILRIEWIDENSFAQITYKKPSNYAVGKVYTLTIND